MLYHAMANNQWFVTNYPIEVVDKITSLDFIKDDLIVVANAPDLETLECLLMFYKYATTERRLDLILKNYCKSLDT